MTDRRTAAFVAVLAALAAGGCGGTAAEPGAPTAAAPPAAPQRQDRPRPRPVDLTVSFSGDLLIHAPVWQRAAALAGGRGYRFAPLLRRLRPWVAGADLAVCHLETPMTPAAPSGYPIFNAPPQLARAIRRTGWDACDTASNHTLDQGAAGIAHTLRALDEAGVRHTGSSRTRREASRILMLRARGVRVALLAATTTTNGLVPPRPWSVALAEPRRLLRDARRARRRGADAVIVNLHWGAEYVHAPTAEQRALARRLARSPAITAIVGQHAHVVQPIRRVRGRWVAFGDGNLLSNQTAGCCPAATQDGLVVLLDLRVRGDRPATVRRVRYVPTWVRHPDFAVLPVGRALRRGWASEANLRASWARTVGVVGRRPGLRTVPRRLEP